MTASTEPLAYTLLWLRHDLRLRDQPALTAAMSDALRHQRPLIAIYFFEPRLNKEDRFGYTRMRPYRAIFLLETLRELKATLKSLNVELIISRDDPVVALAKLCCQLNVKQVYASRHVADEEVRQEAEVATSIKSLGCALTMTWSHTLYSPKHLPFTLGDLPDVYTQFRKQVERSAEPKQALPIPKALPSFLSWGQERKISSNVECHLEALWREWSASLEKGGGRDKRAVLLFKGGAQAGEARVQEYLWDRRLIECYKDTRNGLIGADYSTKFSAWLSVGALSPRWLWWETLRYEDERVVNDSTYWVRFELLWREYFQWVALLYGPSLFKLGGLSADLGRPRSKRSDVNPRSFQRWVEGETGDDFVDAHMKELKHTGFMSNRGRQNVASYLIHDLNLDWRLGAGYFEAQLIDYDPASNWGNWAYIAGVGNDPRPQRKFNTKSQAERYDPKGLYRELWS